MSFDVVGANSSTKCCSYCCGVLLLQICLSLLEEAARIMEASIVWFGGARVLNTSWKNYTTTMGLDFYVLRQRLYEMNHL